MIFLSNLQVEESSIRIGVLTVLTFSTCYFHPNRSAKTYDYMVITKSKNVKKRVQEVKTLKTVKTLNEDPIHKKVSSKEEGKKRPTYGPTLLFAFPTMFLYILYVALYCTKFEYS